MNAVKFEEELPEGWTFLPFGNMKPSTERFDPTKEDNQRYLGLEHIEKDTGKIIGSQESKTTVSLKTIFCKGDLLYGKLRPYLNKVAIADFNGVCSTDILVFSQNPFILNTFLKFRLLKSDFVEFANRTVTGVQHPRTSHKKLSNYPIPLPPLPEQRRIVSKIESIFAQIDAARERLERLVSQTKSVSDSLNVLRSSVLKQAFEGKLVSQDPRDEPIEVLFKQIYNDSKIEFKKINLPNGWINAKINNACKLIGGGTPSRRNLEYFDGNIVWLTPTEISKDSIVRIYNSREKITELGLQKSSAKIIPSDSVLLTSRASIGYVAIAGTEVTTNQGFASFVCSKIINNYFLAYWLWANRPLLIKNATGTTFKEISKSTIKKLEINLPPLSEQKRIVTKIESIFAEIDAIEQYVKSTLQLLDQLKNSTLKQAFEGNLVPQDPNDEPAEFILQKIKQENSLMHNSPDAAP